MDIIAESKRGTPRLGRIVTFYSYKGGTGRSMALANIACLLARDYRKRVLVVDWDLDAPGLHRYFSRQTTEPEDQPGLLDLFLDLKTSADQLESDRPSDFTDAWFLQHSLAMYCVETRIDGLQVMKAGRFDEDYPRRVNTFDWRVLHDALPDAVAGFARRVGASFDYVLIDARTGVSDISGIATMMMPDTLVLVFTPNVQSLAGVLQVVEEASSHRKLSEDLRPLTILPLPSRIEPTVPILQNAWRFGSIDLDIEGYQAQFEHRFRRIYDLTECDLSEYFNEVQIQHVPSYAYGEELAVLTERAGDRLSLTRSYESFAGHLTAGLPAWERRSEASRQPLPKASLATDHEPHSPYPGLRPYSKADAQVFFGRETFVEQLVESVRYDRLVAVVGPSGSGKSSVLFAGLVPRLAAEGGWKIVALRPGERPLLSLSLAVVAGLTPNSNDSSRMTQARDLAESMGRGKSLDDIGNELRRRESGIQRVLVVVDQFEELYTLGGDATEQSRFLDVLLSWIENSPSKAQGTLTFALAMRADALARACRDGRFAKALQRSMHVLGSMTRVEMRRAIEDPARWAGLRIERGLTARILDAVGPEPGNLAIMGFTLNQLWERQEKGILTHASYEAIGGTDGALASYAEDVYRGLSASEQRLAQEVFVQLVRPGMGAADTASTSSRAQLGERNWAVVSQLADARLVVTGRDEVADDETVELVSDALISEWPRLKDWIGHHRRFREWQERLRLSAMEWTAGSRQDWALLRGDALQQASEALHSRSGELSAAEREFIQASVVRHKGQRLRARVVVAAVLAAAAFAFGYNLVERQKAVRESRNARTNSWILHSRDSLSSDPERSVLISLAAVRELHGEDGGQQGGQLHVALNALRRAIQASRIRQQFTGHDDAVYAIDYHEPYRVATAGRDKTVRIWDARDGLEVAGPFVHTDFVNDVAFSPDGRIVASASDASHVSLWDSTSGRQIRKPFIHPGKNEEAWCVKFDPSGDLVASGSSLGAVRAWRLDVQGEDISPAVTLENESGDGVTSIAFSQDGSMLASASLDGSVVVWELETRKRRYTFSHDGHWVFAVEFSPVSSLELVTGSIDGVARSWNLEELAPGDYGLDAASVSFEGHFDGIWSVAFSPDGRRLVTASRDGTARVWNAANGDNLMTLARRSAGLTGAVFGKDGEMVATASQDGTAAIWDATDDNGLDVLRHSSGEVRAVALSRKGLLATAGSDSIIRIWIPETQQLVSTLEGHDAEVVDLEFSLSGEYLASASSDTTARIWELPTGREVKKLEHPARVFAVGFSLDDSLLATGCFDSRVRTWDWRKEDPHVDWLSPDPEIDQETHHNRVYSVAFSPDSKYLASSSQDHKVKIWDLSTGQLKETFEDHAATVYKVAFTQDGRYFISASGEPKVVIRNTKTGRSYEAKGHTAAVRGLATSSDSVLLATASVDGTARLLDLNSGMAVDVIEGHARGIYDVAFGREGQTLITAGLDGTVRFHTLKMKELLRLAEERIARDLEESECTRLRLPSEECHRTKRE